MLSSTQDELFERIVEHLDSGTDPMADQVMEYPVERYVQADHLDREGALLFGKLPLVVGASDRVRSPGDFFTDDLSGWSLLVVRGDDGVLRGFHNMCGHRGSEVKVRESGCSRSFTCPYHAWTYDSEGRLVAIPNDDGFAGLDRSDRGLIEVPVEERHGLVWAQPNSAPGTSLDVAGYLGELDAQLGEFELHSYVHDRTDILRQPFNWKFVIDGFLETYHLRFLHPKTIGPHIHSNFAMCDTYGRHGRMVGLRCSFDAMREAPEQDREVLPHLAVIYQIFPNTILVWQGDHFEAWSSFPNGTADAMSARASLLAPPDLTGPVYDARWDKNWKILMDTVLNEDFPVARAMQRNNASGARTHAIFGRQESALQHFHRSLEHELSSAATTAQSHSPETQ